MGNKNTTIVLPHDSRILVVQPRAGLGDFILLMPSLRALRETYPTARIDLLTSPAIGKQINEQLIKRLNLFDNMILSPGAVPSKSQKLLDPDSYELEHTQFMNLMDDIRSANYNTVLLYQHLNEPSRIILLRYITWATRAKWKVGVDNGQGTFLNVKVPDVGFGKKHQAEFSMDVVEAVGATVNNRSLFFPLVDEEYHQASMLLGEEGNFPIDRPVIAMHPGCASYMKARRWAPEKFAQLADMIYKEFGGKLVLIGGAEELSIREQVARSMQSTMPTQILSGQENLVLTAAVIKQCNFFVGNDSGLMHLSTAVGTPTVGIFGLTNHKAWGPYTPTNPSQSMVVRLNLPCMPCAHISRKASDTPGCSTRDCLNTLSPAFVFAAIRNRLRLIYELPEINVNRYYEASEQSSFSLKDQPS